MFQSRSINKLVDPKLELVENADEDLQICNVDEDLQICSSSSEFSARSKVRLREDQVWLDAVERVKFGGACMT